MLSLPKSLIYIGLLSTTEGAKLSLNSMEAASLLDGNSGQCPINEDTCSSSFKRLYAGNNNDDYLKYSA